MKRTISIAPMMDLTDRHCRYLFRLLSKHVLLYTEMIATGAILHGDRDRLLNFHAQEHPLALQLGGSDPQTLAQCAKLGEQWGYDEINLNVGCPSDRVQYAAIGACLMAKPQLVAECVAAMQQSVNIPVTVKTRIGIDHNDSYDHLLKFIDTVAEVGCKVFIIHARKAWLTGLNPKQNRTIPPLHYDRVYQLKQDFPKLTIIINGGIDTLDQVATHLNHCDGVMIGRASYHNCYMLAEIDKRFYQSPQPPISREHVITEYRQYIASQLALGVPLQVMTRPMISLFQGMPGARKWRRYISEHAHRAGMDAGLVNTALDQLR